MIISQKKTPELMRFYRNQGAGNPALLTERHGNEAGNQRFGYSSASVSLWERQFEISIRGKKPPLTIADINEEN
jgi:hypothetical protein